MPRPRLACSPASALQPEASAQTMDPTLLHSVAPQYLIPRGPADLHEPTRSPLSHAHSQHPHTLSHSQSHPHARTYSHIYRHTVHTGSHPHHTHTHSVFSPSAQARSSSWPSYPFFLCRNAPPRPLLHLGLAMSPLPGRLPSRPRPAQLPTSQHMFQAFPSLVTGPMPGHSRRPFNVTGSLFTIEGSWEGGSGPPNQE